MKSPIIKIFVLVLLISGPLLSPAQVDKVEFQASGLTCSMCSNAINKALKTLPFVQSVSVDLNHNLFVIHFVSGVSPDIDQIKKKVEGAGFSIAKCWISARWSDQQVSSDAHAQLGGMNFHFVNVHPQRLNGEQRLQIIDKDYVSAKEFKRYRLLTSLHCMDTGMMGSCCPGASMTDAKQNRIFHVTI